MLTCSMLTYGQSRLSGWLLGTGMPWFQSTGAAEHMYRTAYADCDVGV